MDSSIHESLALLASHYPTSATLVAILLCLSTTFLVLQEIFKPVGKRRAPTGKQWRLPPGPRGKPILGSLLDLKTGRDDPDHSMHRYLARYGEMTTVHLGPKTWVFLNSRPVVAEIIAKRGSLTNGRSPMPIASGIVSRHSRSLLLPPWGWTEKRRVMHSLLSGTALKQYGSWQELESTQLLVEYYYQPQLWYRHHYRYANSVVHRIALGERLTKSNKELADLQDVVTHFVGSIGSSLVDWFPELDALPRVLQPWRKYWERLGQWNYEGLPVLVGASPREGGSWDCAAIVRERCLAARRYQVHGR